MQLFTNKDKDRDKKKQKKTKKNKKQNNVFFNTRLARIYLFILFLYS